MSKREIPHFKQPIIETHCHLDYLTDQPLADILRQAQALGVERVITISVAPDNLAIVLGLTERFANVWGTQGIHPHDAAQYSAEVAVTIREHLAYERILAVGEIGLDYYYDHSDRAIQRRVFEQQLQIAADHQLPVVIHTREADADTRSILSNFSAVMKNPNKGVIHSFTSGLALAEYCISEGFCLGFNGICTFNKAQNVRDIISATPLEHILLETDAPYLTPTPYRGKENAPYYLPLIAEKIAAVKQLPVDTVLAQTYRNSLNVFFAGTTSVQ